jgi:hypothetical protein
MESQIVFILFYYFFLKKVQTNKRNKQTNKRQEGEIKKNDY